MFPQRIPRKFKDEYKEKLLQRVTLRGPSGDCWTVALAQRGEDIELRNGWRDFVKDHSLEEGDFLVFQHVENSLFNVLMFDKTGCEREDSHFVIQDRDIRAENCCYMRDNKTDRPSTIPREFADNCLPMVSQEIRLRVGSKIWRVSLNRRNVQCTLNKGWAHFVLDNNLETEDYCVLELADTGTSRQPLTLDVHIYRAVEKIVPLKVILP
uniref:TF-B3 domain-containing protein n=1 Tax=Chenopodium quinoa TaxID=63459 RepID=A0A803MCN2_CHEQI